MTTPRPSLKRKLLALAILIVVLGPAASSLAQSVSISKLSEQTHIHGLAVDRANPERLLIATHHGLFGSGLDGEAVLLSLVQDFMGFTPDPTKPHRLYASGHPRGGGNLGFIASADNGMTWIQVSPGANGPVDFHQMTVSLADPKVVYGAYGELQVSRDAGQTWTVIAPLPGKLIDLAASAENSDTVYAATESGLSVSRDGGRTWKPVLEGLPVSLVEVTADGTIYAFVVGQGLARASEADLEFTTISKDWDDRILLHLAVDPQQSDRIFVASHQGEILASEDGGLKWTQFGS